MLYRSASKRADAASWREGLWLPLIEEAQISFSQSISSNDPWFWLPRGLIQTPPPCARFSRHQRGESAWQGRRRPRGLKKEGARDRRRKSKASESCSEHGTQACEPRDEELVICSVLMSAELHEQSWRSEFCVLNRNVLETGLLKHCVISGLLRNARSQRRRWQREKRACKSGDIPQGKQKQNILRPIDVRVWLLWLIDLLTFQGNRHLLYFSEYRSSWGNISWKSASKTQILSISATSAGSRETLKWKLTPDRLSRWVNGKMIREDRSDTCCCSCRDETEKTSNVWHFKD